MGYACGMKWSEELIETKLKEVVAALCIDRMPSNTECTKVTGSAALSNAIRRNGGFYKWADKIGMSIKESETKLGDWGEREIERVLTDKGYNAKMMSVKHPYDILVNDSIKIDVKTAKRYYYTDKNYFYTFNIEKKNPTCDIYICLCILNNEVERVLVIPSKLLKVTQLSIGATSAYDKFINRWDYVDKYNDFYQQIV